MVIFCHNVLFAIDVFKDLRLNHVALVIHIPIQHIVHSLEVARHIVTAHKVIVGTVLDEQVVHQIESAAVDHMDHTAAVVRLVHHHGGTGHVDLAGVAVDRRAFQRRVVEERVVRDEGIGVLHVQRTALGGIVPEARVIKLGCFVAFPHNLVHFQREEIFPIDRAARFRFVHTEVGNFDLHIQLIRFLGEEVRRAAQGRRVALEVHFVHVHFRAVGNAAARTRNEDFFHHRDGLGIGQHFFRRHDTIGVIPHVDNIITGF